MVERLNCHLRSLHALFTDSIFSWNQDISGLQDHEFQIRHPDSPALLYQFRLGDEKLQVIYGCIFSWTERKPARFNETERKCTCLKPHEVGVLTGLDCSLNQLLSHQ